MGLATAYAFAAEGYALHPAARASTTALRVVGVSPGDMSNECSLEFLRRRTANELGDPDRWRERLSRLLGGRAATSENVADAILFLASPRVGYVSGTVPTVDGAMGSRLRVI